jgi:predicted extracellular nuclease
MKQSLFKLSAIALILAMVFSFLPGQPARAATTIIAQWTFESPNTPAAASAAIYPNAIAPAVGSGNAGGVHTSASTAWSTPVGNGSAYSFSSNNWSVGNYYQFSTNTAGFTGISVSWDQTGSATGPRDFKLAYSTDGTTFTDFYSYSLPSPAVSWSSGSTSLATKFSSDLSSVTALDNQANVYFRLIDTSTTSIGGGTVGTAGTGRVDNFTVRGTGVDSAPSVLNTVPANGAVDVPLNSNININFSEPVNVTDPWFSLSCAISGTHSAAVSGGSTNFTLTPDVAFAGGEQCTLMIYASQVNDQDSNDPPDNMTVNFTTGFTTINPTIPTGVGAASPSALYTGDPTLLTVAVTPGTNPPSTGLNVTCDLTAIGGPATQAFYDDGTNGDVTASDNTFSFSTTVVGGTAGGAKSLDCTIGDDQSRSGSATIGLTVTAILPIGTVNGPVGDTDDGTLHRSPYAPASGNGLGSTVVVVQGVIYEKTVQAISNSTNTYKGFFIQNTAATADSDPNTSDGLFVFMSTASIISGPSGPYTPQVGDEVVLSGKVSEYYNMTELQSLTLVKPVLRSGVDIEAEVPPVVANPPVSLADANRYWERLQGMRVQVPQDSIVLGGRNVFSPADAEIWVARPDSKIALRADPYARKAFRDAHPLDDNYDPTNWDGNGYRILMGSLGIKALVGDAQALIDPARSYSTVINAPAGGLNYTFSKYRIEISQQPTFSEGVDPSQNNPPGVFDRSIHYSIVDYNLENLYDYRDNPFSGCDFAGNPKCLKSGTPFLSDVTPPYDYVPASDADYQARLNDIALEIVNDLHSPDILMVQEVENQDICTVTDGALACGSSDNADGKPDVLQELALKIAALGGPAYDAAFDRNSSDLRGIAPAFLYRTDRVQLLPPAGDLILGTTPTIDGYTAVPYDSDVSNPKTLNAVYSGPGACETSWVFPRAPDIGLFRIYSTAIGVGSHRDVYVINNHFKSGPDTCVAHRTEQAKYNAALVAYIQAANPGARIVVGGDLNVYPRPDDIAYGASDQLGSLYNPGLGLTNLWDVLLGQAPESAYSYVYLGMAQTLDQMFVNAPMLTDLTQFRIAHINSDFPADYPGDVARGTSDHDPNVATFVINDPPTVDAGGPYTVNEGGSVTLTATGSDPEGQPLTYAWDLDDNGVFETPGQSVIFTAPPNSAPAAYTVKVQVTDNGGLTAVDSATVNVVYNFAGFFNPVDNLPAWNSAKAGSAIPVKFSLGGDKGLNILAAGYPQSVQIACNTGAVLGNPEPTANPGGSRMSYGGGKYNYVWKTEKSWSGTCRQLIVKLIDGTLHYANFTFK